MSAMASFFLLLESVMCVHKNRVPPGNLHNKTFFVTIHLDAVCLTHLDCTLSYGNN